MNAGVGKLSDVLFSGRMLPVVAAGAILSFLFAVNLLGAATDAAAPLIERSFDSVVTGDAAALGLGWSSSYVLANGSVIAALALSLFTADIATTTQLFLLVVGSRLGAAAVVVFIGALDYAQQRIGSLQKAVSMGVLTFLLTHSIYVPVTVLGYVGLPYVGESLQTLSRDWSPDVPTLGVFDAVTGALTASLGAGLSFALAVGLLLGSLKLFDRILAHVETSTLRNRFFDHLQRTWLSFVIGLLVTGVTTSVAFSLGVIVPLYNRGYIERGELIPYVLGANLGTLFDTLLVALVLESATGTAVVLEILAVATLVTLVALVGHDRYSALVVAADDVLLEDRRVFVAFVVSLVVVPLALLFVPTLLG